MIFVDTGAYYALTVAEDKNHAAAEAFFSSRRETLVTTDYIVDELLTLMRARGRHQLALVVGRWLLIDGACMLLRVTKPDFAAAWSVFEQYADKEWSFTDCTSKVVMERLGITRAAAFDRHFHEFGTVAVFP